MQIFGSIGWLLGFILWGAFYIFKNFGIAIIVFTIIVKAALFPFTLKQQKSMAGSARMAKKQKELREKYGNNRQKLQEEIILIRPFPHTDEAITVTMEMMASNQLV